MLLPLTLHGDWMRYFVPVTGKVWTLLAQAARLGALGLLLGLATFVGLSKPSLAVVTIDPGLEAGTGTFGRESDMVLDAAGNPVAVFSDQVLDEVYFVHCDDANCDGGDASKLLAIDASQPSIVLDSFGFPVIGYADMLNQQLVLVHCNDALCEGDDESSIQLADIGLAGGKNRVVLDGNGFPVIAYKSNDGLELIHCNDVQCAGANDATNEIGPTIAGNIDMRLDASGFPVISFTGFLLQLAHCNDVNCAGGNESIEILGTLQGFDTTLRLDSDGFPVISYSEGGDVMLAHCNDANCADGDDSISTVLTAFNPSMELDESGRPIISSISGSAVRLTRCDEAFCVDSNELTSTVTGFAGFRTSLEIDGSGNPVIGTYRSPGWKLIHCNDGFCASDDESVRVVTDVKSPVGRYSSLAINGSQLYASHYAPKSGDLRLVHCNDTACDGIGDFQGVVRESGDTGSHTSIVLDGGGLPVISHYDVTNANLEVINCTHADCTSFDVVAVDATGDVGTYTSVALDGAGLPAVSYFDIDDDDLKLAHCATVSCVSFDNSVQVVDASGGIYTSLVLDGDGFPVISYYFPGSGDLKLAHCNDADCDPAVNGAESLEVVDSTNDVGMYSSLRLDSMGYPMIAYYDATTGDLKLAHCNDADCSGSDESIVIVDSGSGDDVGLYASIGSDPSGNPVVSYHDATNGDLLLVRCGNASCTGASHGFATLDTEGTAGIETSLVVIGTTAFVSYFEQAESVLKLAEATLPSIPGADMGVDKADSVDPIGPSSTLSYTVSVENLGPDTASNVVVVDTLHAEVSFLSAIGDGWSCLESALVVTCDRASLAVGSAPDITIEVTTPTTSTTLTNDVTVTADEPDTVPGNDSGSETTTVDGDPPMVAAIGTVADTGDGLLEHNERVRAAVTQFSVSFDEAVSGIDQISSYQLVFAGVDGVRNTGSCAGLVGDDASFSLNLQLVDGDTAWMSTLVGIPLPQGLYRLFACASALTDAVGQALDGNGDNTGGDDFMRDFEISPIHRLSGNFDSSLSGWEILGEAGEVAHDSLVDAGAAPTSGTAKIINLTGISATMGLSQCLTAQEAFWIGGRASIDSATPGDPVLMNTAEFYTSVDCSGSPLDMQGTAGLVGDTGSTFSAFEDLVIAPETAQSMRLTYLVDAGDATSFTLQLDDAFAFDESPIFLDGFESGDTTAWSSP